ncbi:MAG: hypothetical protein HRT81_12535 [Henriciella sp.]|nr:hypothetical protein [Henriciella sp.]
MAFRFNDELLLSEEDRNLAISAYPNVYFALDHPELREEFQRVDKLANAAKRASRRVGCAALIFATLSLLTFPFALMLQGVFSEQQVREDFLLTLGILGATFGLFALIFGNLGLGFGRVKRKWLQQRLITERLRQWHAQHLVSHAAEIAEVAGSDEDRSAWLAQRALAFARFKRTFIDQIGSEYTKYTNVSAAAYSGQSIVDPRESTEFWIDKAWAKTATKRPQNAESIHLEELYRALEETRIRGQIQYTNYVLSADGKFWSSPAKQLHILGNLSYVLVLLSFVANFFALIAAIATALLGAGDDAFWEIPSALAIAFAIVAVGARAMLEGLRPQRETRRMEFYATAVDLASRRFGEAKMHSKRIEAASLLERASYDEMVEYISSNERARFVL